MNFFKSVMKILIISALIAAAFVCGMYLTKFRQNREENKSTITTIAVVNADTGTMVKGEKKFYASELMTFPDTNFESTGLTEAREGILNGRYAAYILIPGSFSDSIESINKEPVKAQITYALNNNLRQDVQVKVVNDIHNFILNLSTNVSYVYVDAILQEMHAVQDDSRTVMDNDVKDMEAITGVREAELIEEAEYEPLKIVETEIEFMDLSDDYFQADQAVDEIYKTYEKNMEEAETEFAAIKEEGLAIGGGMTAMAETFGAVDILTDDQENCVYEEGMAHLSNLSNEFKSELDHKKFKAKERLGFKEGDEEPDPEPELPEGEERVYLSKDDLLYKVDEQIAFMEKVQITIQNQGNTGEAYSEGDDAGEDADREDTAGEDASGEGGDDDIPEELPITEDEVEESLEDLYALKQDIEKYYEDGIRAVNEIPDASEFASDAEQIISEEIASPVMEETARESENVMTAVNDMQFMIDEYVAKIDEYDAMSYLEREVIEDYLSSLFTVIGDMEDEIMEQDTAYMEYIDEVTRTADENIQMLQESLDKAQEQTQKNIFLTMDDFKENRSNINELNVFLLNDITQKLPYTRLGNLEYTQVYDFIVQPVVPNDVSAENSGFTPTSVNMDKADLICMFIGITALIIIYIAVQLIHKRFLLKKESGEEGEIWQAE